MVRTLVAGLDGSPESSAAAEWAAREAELRGLPLKIVHVWEPAPDPLAQAPLLGAETQQHWSERIPREAGEGLRRRHPGVDVTVEQVTGTPSDALVDAAKDAELLVLGSRGLSGVGGFLVGSVGLSVVARAELPVVLVRADEQAADETSPVSAAPYRPVVLGLDAGAPSDTVIEFAFAEAARRDTSLRVVYGWNIPPYYAYGLALDAGLHDELSREETDSLTEALRPWRQKHPEIEVALEPRVGSAADHLVDASREASLVVIGRRIRRGAFGAHIGPVAHGVLHHSTAPVAVVAHD
ncbi:Nucleotide-binding universal stress protein, UspA family [Streptomyces sp. 3213]|uniref:universal stress protein n=1 Tax=Streptomyces sp. 3213.3 TaxID=1855348 RepID=UPI00089D0DB5|nr:universal stress protein [Streptomyces sp. 3213.3]SEC76054.1 Nucleotide-binding universal stress protein, UspA family [Streptomyces sp. 3213] [Streptomyces sp. 3213.3]